MPGKGKHTEKFDRCVEQVMAKGNEQSSAYAICTTQFQKSGEPILLAAEEGEVEETYRYINLIGAARKPRRELHEGREHLVVPVRALVEGVVRAMNSKTPELVRAEKLKLAPGGWDGRPLFAGHPVERGLPISGNDPRILERAFGRVFHSEYDDGLRMEAWIDVEKAKTMPEAARVLERCLAHERGDKDAKPIEVSVGALIGVKKTPGTWRDGKAYTGEWDIIVPDHLALLAEDKVGACSVAMGCGAFRAASLAPDGGYEEYEGEENIMHALEGMQEKPSLSARVMAFFRSLAGRRHSANDEEMLQDIHDQSVSLGAMCVEPRMTGAHECTCRNATETNNEPGGIPMDRTKTIAALAANPHSAIKDPKQLEKMDDVTLQALETGAEATANMVKAAKDGAEAAIKAAKDGQAQAEVALKAAQDALAAPVSEDRLPAEYRSLMSTHREAEAKEKTALVISLKAAQTAWTEEELNAKPIEELRKFATAFAKPTPSMVGKPVPRMAAEGKSFAPPDPYKAQLDARKTAAH